MDTVRNYNRLALDYLNMAERTHYPATREEMTRLAQLWARLLIRQNRGNPLIRPIRSFIGIRKYTSLAD